MFFWIVQVESIIKFDNTSKRLTEFPSIPANTEEIILNKNDIMTVSTGNLSHFTRLIRFYMNENSLTEIPLFGPNIAITLRVLHLQRNEINYVNEMVLNGLLLLDNLQLQYNSFTEIPPFDPNITWALRTLNLAYNNIHYANETILNSLLKLEYLSLEGNEIEIWPVLNLPVLRDLILRKNHINTMSEDSYKYLPNLRNVQVQENDINELPNMDYIKPHTNIYAHANEITLFPNVSHHGASLIRLQLAHNHITYIPAELLDPLVKLKYLLMDYNELTTVPNVEGPGQSLLELTVNKNQISDMPQLDKLGQSLTRLVIAHNENLHNKKYMLKGMDNLKVISLTNTAIKELPNMAHLGDHLTELWLQHLRDVTISPLDMLMINKFAKVYMASTTFAHPPASLCSIKPGAMIDLRTDVCTCEMSWLKMAALNGLTLKHDTTLCDGVPWKNFTMEEFMHSCSWQQSDENTLTKPYGRY